MTRGRTATLLTCRNDAHLRTGCCHVTPGAAGGVAAADACENGAAGQQTSLSRCTLKKKICTCVAQTKRRSQAEYVIGNATVHEVKPGPRVAATTYAGEHGKQGAQGMGASEGFLTESTSSGVRGVAAGSEPPVLAGCGLCSAADMLGRGVPPWWNTAS